MKKIKFIFLNNLNILILVSIFLLLFAIILNFFEINLSYSYFIFLRWTVFFTYAYLTYRIFRKNQNSKLIIPFLLMLILFNPILPISFSVEIWIFIDFLCLCLLFITFNNINKIKVLRVIKLFYKNIVELIAHFFIDFIFHGIIELFLEYKCNVKNIFIGFLLVLLQFLIFSIYLVIIFFVIEKSNFNFLSNSFGWMLFLIATPFFIFLFNYKEIFDSKKRECMSMFISFIGFLFIVILILFFIYQKIFQ